MNNLPTIIPIGQNCSITICLRNLGLRKLSYPFDWARSPDLNDIIEIVKNGENNFILKEWKFLKDIDSYLPHDKLGDSHGITENNFENVTFLEKYERRFKRFFNDIKISNTYLIRFGVPGEENKINILQQLLPHCKIILIDGSIETPEKEFYSNQKLMEIFGNNTQKSLQMELYNYQNFISTIMFPCNFKDILNSSIFDKYFVEFNNNEKIIFNNVQELVKFISNVIDKYNLQIIW